MPYIPPEVVAQAREMDLLTYLRTYEPQELVHFGGSTYCTREHDSLKISNGKWCWFSRGIGGYSALDYLIKVKEMPFTQAVETIMGNLSAAPPAFAPTPKAPKEKVLLLPQVNRSATYAIEYLHRRGIDYELIDFCIQTGRLYESYTRDDGSIGVSYNIKRVYDISQTTARTRAPQAVSHDARALLNALIYKRPAPVQSVDELPNGMDAVYEHKGNRQHSDAVEAKALSDLAGHGQLVCSLLGVLHGFILLELN